MVGKKITLKFANCVILSLIGPITAQDPPPPQKKKNQQRIVSYIDLRKESNNEYLFFTNDAHQVPHLSSDLGLDYC